MAKISQRALDAVVTPGWVLTGHAQYEFNNLVWSGRPPDLVASPTLVPFGSHQFPMPAQDRIRSYDSGNLLQHLPAEDLAFDRQTAPLVIVEQDAFLAELFFEDLVLSTQVLDGVSCCR